MTRSYTALSIVTVPRLSAATALTLGTALVSAARKGPGLPPAMVLALEPLERELGALRRSRQLQREVRSIDGSIAVAADQALDTNWSGFHAFLVGWTKLANAPEAAERAGRARDLLEIVYPEGLRFLNLPYCEQWGESEIRLARLAEPRHAEHVRALGGEAFVGAIRRSHEAYGVALNVTERKAEAEAQVRVREALDAFIEALRSYLLRVAAYVDEHARDEEAQAIGRALLRPITTWKGQAARKGEPPEGDQGGGPGGDGSTRGA
jgi:hypothetical protein